MVNALRAVPKWREAFSQRFQADMLEAIDARNMPRLARVARSFLTEITATELLDHLDKRRRGKARIPLDLFCVR
jgi:hypothetical protein